MNRDVVYVCREGENPELRYSLRSLSNLPHRSVVVYGGAPSWYRGWLERIEHDDSWDRRAKTLVNFRAAMADPGLTEEVVFMCDDHFIMEPMVAPPVTHWGPMADRQRWFAERYPRTRYTEAMRETEAMLHRWGYPDPLCYEMHTPMVINRPLMREVLARIAADAERHVFKPKVRAQLHYQTIYCNVAGVGGEYADDRKVYDMDDGPWRAAPLISTNDRTFADGEVGRFIRESFPDPSPYEE